MLKRAVALAGLIAATAVVPGLDRTAAAQERVVIAGGVDVIGMNALDVVNIVPDRSLMDNIAGTLLRWIEPGKLGPWLAVSYKNIDPVTWEIKLRQGVKFHNGEPFNAEAVKFFYDTMADPNVESPSKTNHTYVDHVEVIDEYTVHLITKMPYPTTPNQLAMAHMIPPKYVQEVGFDGYRKHPIGTGPFKFVEHVRDSHITLAANEDWWGGAPKIKELVYRPIKEDAARVAALIAGEVDMAVNVPDELVPLIEGSPNVQLKSGLSGRVFMVLLNAINPDYPTAKEKVRQALNYAIDRDSINQNILAGAGAASAWLDPDIFGYDHDQEAPKYDPEKAKQLLAEAGYPNGIDIVLDSPDGRYIKDSEVAQAMAGQMAAAGIRVEVRTNEWGVLTKRVFSHTTNPMTLAAWGNSTGTPESHLRLALKSGGSWSQSADPEMDKQIDALAVEMDPEKQTAMYKDFQAYLREHVPMLYVVQQPMFAGVSDKLTDFKLRSDERYYFFDMPAEVMGQ